MQACDRAQVQCLTHGDSKAERLTTRPQFMAEREKPPQQISGTKRGHTDLAQVGSVRLRILAIKAE